MSNPAAISRRTALLPSLLLLCMSTLSPSLAQQHSSQQTPMPSFAFSWLGDKAAFQAGDTAVIMVWALDLPAGRRSSFSFSVSVNGKKGNSSYITDVAAHLGGDPASWNITFVPLRAGDFVALVAEERLGVGVSSLQFTVTAAGVHPSASLVSWMFYSGYVAGSKAFVCVVPKDAFGNDVACGTDMPGDGYFMVSGSYVNGSAVEFLDFQFNGWTEDGCLSFEFGQTLAGDFLVHIFGNNTELRDSPLLLTVKPGLLDIAKSTCSWKHGTNILQIFSKLEIFIYQKDTFGNIVPEIHPFNALVVDRASNLSVPVVDLPIEAVADGVQLLSFNVVEPGEFALRIFDAQLNQKVSNMVYMFDVFVGYCDGSNSFASGSGLAHSVAGSVSSFNVFLEDQSRSPSPIETAVLQVKILIKNGTSYADPIITPIREPNGTISMEGQSSFDLGPAGLQEIIAGNSTVQASQFNVSYTPQIAGEYEIWVLCGNIALNGGNPYAMTVLPGAINTSLSSVLMFDPMVKRSVQNEVTVRLVDSFMNSVLSLESKLRFQITSASIATPVNTTSFMTGNFVDNRDGSYTAPYVARNLGSYSMCVQFEDKQLAPCPFEIHVLEDEYFSDVKNDSISVWEDESVSFDVLSNDCIAGSKAEIVNSSSPLHGSVLQFNKKYRYTPFEGFFGNDSFSYTISDEHNNVVTATVFISVLCRPPQFISLPQQLHVTEDIISPKFGGFPGIKIVYSDTAENISVTVKAQSGNVFLAPMPMKLQQPSDDVLSISRGGRAGKDLILQGTVEAINGGLQFLQYIGNEDFYGNDVIALYAMNRNGIQDARFPIFVEPVNDPPVILAPRSIFLGGKESRGGYKIFDKHRDTFQFSIVEPDLRSFPGNKSHLLLVLSLEVFEGTLTTTLPAGTIPTTELKTERINHWQPLEDYVIISNHFVLRGTAIRFRGNVQDCNNAMQHLFYHGPSHGTTLSITVNDLGNYGCYPDCSEKMSTPLSTAKTIRLVKTKHMNSRIALMVESVLVIEILTMLCLGGVLLYFLFKCMKTLKDERRDRTDNEMRTLEQTPFHQRRALQLQSEDVGYCSAPAVELALGADRSSFRQRSSRSCKKELELQPVSETRNNENQDGLHVTDKDK
ncbi:protein GAMETE EXPRESSED 2 isoform X2 [Phragmites australis]|uniref:protein GAMETE EXPRESSED 2 isoform X2 n=1 Tax=Phragmites australis TaxID=29695 RepID=UPI002D7A27D9|nr:protein GAMETE EXPRESSED 2 isoform X2 [Phragmites australis]